MSNVIGHTQQQYGVADIDPSFSTIHLVHFLVCSQWNAENSDPFNCSKDVGGRADCKQALPDHLKDFYQRIIDGLDPERQAQVCSLLCEFSNVFSKGPQDLGYTEVIQHCINTQDAAPIHQPLHHLPLAKQHHRQRKEVVFGGAKYYYLHMRWVRNYCGHTHLIEVLRSLVALGGATKKWWKMCTMVDSCGYTRQLLTIFWCICHE